MIESEIQAILFKLRLTERELSKSFRDSTAGEERHAAAAEIKEASCLIERAAKRFGIENIGVNIEHEGRVAYANGIPWYKNPYPSGSWEAYAWDGGNMEAHKASQ